LLNRFEPKGSRQPPKEVVQRYGSYTDKMGTNTALQALGKIERAAKDTRDPVVLFARAAVPLGPRIKGSPYDEWLQIVRQWEARRRGGQQK